MRIGTYTDGEAGPRPCLIVDDGIVDLQRAGQGELSSTVLDLLAMPDWQSRLGELEVSEPHRPLSDVTLATPIARPGKILAAAGNYQAHIDEGGGAKVDKARRTPRLFSKPPTTLIGPDDPLVLPKVSSEVDWELELAVVIGQTCREVPVEKALDHVAGYTIMNDVSARSMDWGIEDREVHEWDRFFDWLAGKWVDGFAPTGPWIVTADEIPDPHDLRLTLTLNGETYQDASTGGMIFDCADLIAFASRFTTLEPGDMIATGTPAGVGVATGRFLGDGDVMVGAIEGIGTLRTPVVAP